ncbi:MAG: polyprenol monophosphomannose synthase [candidate division Zixibacteria bacterium]|nr:polyprenol monophosphomannose synthase [candidate division Zixibacteria bacterium]MBU1469467.1 polyprenol monophosphomannose synthase [candidate division Zixibacteria bacterium]MBU2624221.1 polyprenol monophosphomannose synthase [candidate division Zixibacteria bacterium]
MADKALVLLPTYNEKENIERIIPKILQQDDRLYVLVIDDNSPDGTGDIADRIASANPRVMVMHREKKEGLGQAYIAGFRWALERDYNYIFEMDADFSHDPIYLKDFLVSIKKYDIVLGSRYISGVNVVNWPIMRLLLSYYANVYSRIVTGLPLRDATGGFKCFRREVLEAINLDDVKSNGYSFQIEMSLRAHKKGFKIKEIPIIFYDRTAGQSKMSKKIIREAVVMVWRLRIWSILGKLK